MAGKHSKKLFCKNNSVVLSKKTDKCSVTLPFKIIITAIVFCLVLSLVLASTYFVPSKTQSKLLDGSANTFKNAITKYEGLQILESQNGDIKGWLEIEGTDIDSAVCQHSDDSYYLNHNQEGKKSRYGALFLSATDTFERNGDKNIVIYGNNMKDGLMFGTLKKYRNLNFYKQNPIVNLYYNDKAEKYLIFAVMLVSSSADDGGKVYNPSKSYFSNENEFNEWYSETVSRSIIKTTVDLSFGDEILTLVTVADDFDNARLAVMAKKTDDFEISQTDISAATVNSEIKYPKIWYTERGMKYPY